MDGQAGPDGDVTALDEPIGGCARLSSAGRTISAKVAPARSDRLGDADLVPAAGGALDDPEGQVVDQLVGDHHPGAGTGGQVGQGGHHRARCRGRRPGSSSGSGGTAGPSTSSAGSSGRWSAWAARSAGRAFDQHVAQGGGAAGAGPEDVRGRAGRGRRPASTTRNGSGRPSWSHHPSTARATSAPEQRADLDAGDEVGTRPAGAPGPGEEPAVRVVERRFHPLVERERALTADPLRPAGRPGRARRPRSTDPSWPARRGGRRAWGRRRCPGSAAVGRAMAAAEGDGHRRAAGGR